MHIDTPNTFTAPALPAEVVQLRSAADKLLDERFRRVRLISLRRSTNVADSSVKNVIFAEARSSFAKASNRLVGGIERACRQRGLVSLPLLASVTVIVATQCV